jgi:hypothetical protein
VLGEPAGQRLVLFETQLMVVVRTRRSGDHADRGKHGAGGEDPASAVDASPASERWLVSVGEPVTDRRNLLSQYCQIRFVAALRRARLASRASDW